MVEKTEHLKVAIRVRPLLDIDKSEECTNEITNESICVLDGTQTWNSSYDKIFKSDCPQEDIFEFVKQSIESVPKGFNCTIMAYGQTGSGKTYTMFGANWESNNPASQVYYFPKPQLKLKSINSKGSGIIPKGISCIFSKIENKPVTVYCSFLQIYNEKIYDLLQNPTRDKPLNIREDKESGIFVENLAEYVIEKAEDCVYLLKQGDKNRVVRQTRFNHHSSRSHSIFQILIEADRANKRGALKRAKLNLCDLAGSEKFDKDGRMLREHIQEMNSINKSLTTLGKVISALGTGFGSHVPYRESKLTRILQDSLGISTRTILIATISPARRYVEETINTLKFADRAKQVMVKITKNEISALDDSLVSKLQREIQHLKSLLNKRGEIKEISKEILALKEENERLKKITKNLTIEEVENLKQENKRLRIELQNLKEKGDTSESFFDDPKPISTKSSKPESVSQPSEIWKGQEEAVGNMKFKIFNDGRCPVCTLKPPCKHFEFAEDMPKAEIKSISLPPCKKPASETRRDLELLNTSHDHRKLSFRTRAKNTYIEESAALKELKEEQTRKNKLKETEARLVKLAKLEAYREEKMKKEIEILENERLKEEKEYLNQQLRETNRKKYLDKQKKKLEEFQRLKELEVKHLQEKMMKDEENRRKKEEKKKQYLDEQKKKVAEYHNKKKMMEEVTMDQIEELSI